MAELDFIDTKQYRVEGWVNIWEIDAETNRQLFAEGNSPKTLWEPRFLVLHQNISTLDTAYCEETTHDVDFEDLALLRLDGGKEAFDKRWGYYMSEQIKQSISLLPAHVNVSTENVSCELRRGSISSVLNESSYTKVADRRGSVPGLSLPLSLVPDDDNMDAISTNSHNKLSNLFSKKTFKSNLKRTKSATKLDRKRSASNLLENEASVISSRLRAARSHDSLLTSPKAMHSIDLSAGDVEIKPLHSSILGQEHCFQVSTSNGSKYISCQSAEERDKWIDNLRKTVHPNQEQSRRMDNSLKLWIVEAKNVPGKKRYFCEILLDKTLYARTSSKYKSEMLFWGEHFEFNNIPCVTTLTINIYREADKKKKKDRNHLIGFINIPVSEINKRQLSEKWYTASPALTGRSGRDNKCEGALLRVKARYQTVHILPMEMYKDLINYVTRDYCQLCEALEPALNVRDKEDVATTLVRIMQRLNQARQFLADIVISEISSLDNEHLAFRGNTIATKAVEAYMKLVGEKYLHDTLGEFVRSILEMSDDCEVDPNKVSANSTLSNNQTNLRMYCEMACVKVINSYCYFPTELREVFAAFRQRCEQQNKPELSDHIISASIFLRFICPAILSPSLFGLTKEYPHEKAARNLTLIAKTLQTLANFSKFGGGKEEYMTFMNSFVDQESAGMKNFIAHISSSKKDGHFLEFDGYIDLGKELSILHGLVLENLQKTSNETLLLKLEKLSEILSAITQHHQQPSVTAQSDAVQNSQMYDNMNNNDVNTVQNNNNTQSLASPTQVLRDMLRVCGEDVDILNINSTKESPVYQNDVDYTIQSQMPTPVSNVSANQSPDSIEKRINRTWDQMVSAADVVNGEYVDLIAFMDDSASHDQNSSLDERDICGSQVSISQLSNIASSGYQSFGYSQSSSPVESGGVHTELGTDASRSRLQPLSFANPVFRHAISMTSHVSTSPMDEMSSCSSLSSCDESSLKRSTSSKKAQFYLKSSSSSSLVNLDASNQLSLYNAGTKSTNQTNPYNCSHSASSSTSSGALRQLASVSSSDDESLTSEQPKYSSAAESSYSSQSFDPRRKPLVIQSPRHKNASTSQVNAGRTDAYSAGSLNRTGAYKSDTVLHRSDLSQNADLSVYPAGYDAPHSSPLRHPPFDTPEPSLLPDQISAAKVPRHTKEQCSHVQDRLPSLKEHNVSLKTSLAALEQYSGSTGRRRASNPTPPIICPAIRRASQGSVPLGISPLPRRSRSGDTSHITSQTDSQDADIDVLERQLLDSQRRFEEAEAWLRDHPSIEDSHADEWTHKLEMTEERMKRQKEERDEQMQSIIKRLMNLEAELAIEKLDMAQEIEAKERVIQNQAKRISTLDSTNTQLMNALNELTEQYSNRTHNGSVLANNGSKPAPYKSSLC